MPDWHGVFPAYLDGDHLVMGPEIGAAIASRAAHEPRALLRLPDPGRGVRGPAALPLVAGKCGCPHAIWVNQQGERFCDESFYKDYQPRARYWDGKKQEQPNLQPYLIFDGNYRERYPLGSFMPGQPLPEGMVVRGGHAARARAEARHRRRRASSGRSSASTQHAEKGEDPDFGKGSLPWAVRLVGDLSYTNPNVGPLEQAAVLRGEARAGLASASTRTGSSGTRTRR